jgi:hypothetical protein
VPQHLTHQASTLETILLPYTLTEFSALGNDFLSFFLKKSLPKNKWHYQFKVLDVVFLKNYNCLQRQEGTSFKLG